MHSFWLGLASGAPLMIAVGPIAVLLMELGIEGGVRRAWPAAVGVAGADLTFATLAAVSGATLERALHPYAAVMQIAAAGLLLVLAAVMFRRAVAEIRQFRIDGRIAVVDDQHRSVDTSADRLRLTGRMLGLTMVNPLTIVAFTSLVVATGERASNFGWPLGIATASLLVHGSLVTAGSLLRRALPPLGPSWFRVAGSLLIVGLATNLVVR